MGGVQRLPPQWIMGRKNRPWTKGDKVYTNIICEKKFCCRNDKYLDSEITWDAIDAKTSMDRAQRRYYSERGFPDEHLFCCNFDICEIFIFADWFRDKYRLYSEAPRLSS